MVFAHDTEASLVAAVALVNSVSRLDGTDTMTTVDALEEFFREHHYTGRLDQDEAELEAVRRLRPRLRELLVAERDDAAELVNAMLS